MKTSDKPFTEKIEKEKLFTVDDVEEFMGLNKDVYWFRVVHEVTRDKPPWAMFRIQAIRR